jgi:hypothetical protein
LGVGQSNDAVNWRFAVVLVFKKDVLVSLLDTFRGVCWAFWTAEWA